MLPQLRCREMRHPLVLLLRAFCGSLCLCACFASKCMHFLKDITIYAPMFVSIYAYLCTAHTHTHIIQCFAYCGSLKDCADLCKFQYHMFTVGYSYDVPLLN